MPTQITSKEVLNCLNYLGYNNINAMQLKEFVKDLKKLIKYEERRRKNDCENGQRGEPYRGSDYQPPEKESEELLGSQNANGSEVPPARHQADIFEALHSHGTCSSKAKVVPKKESVILLRVKKSRCLHSCVHPNKENICNVESTDKFEDNVESKEKLPGDVEEPENVNALEGQSSKSNAVIIKKPSNISRSKSSFIRPPIFVNNRSDPVALYHQYKAGWERQKIPGESQRSELRWAVREKMLSRTSVSRI